MMYVPTVMLYFVGVSVFVLGPGHQALADNKAFALSASLGLLAILVVLNVIGLGVGKWINNLGAIGTFVAAAVLIGLGAIVWFRFGTSVTAADFRIPADPRFVLNSFGVICFGLVGLELASVMGDEIENPAQDLARRGGLGRRFVRSSIYRRDADAADRGQQAGHQRVAGHRAGGESHGGAGERIVDRGAVCVFAECIDRGNRLGVAGGLGAHSLRRRARFVHAVVAGPRASEIRDAVRGADRARCRFDDSGRGEFHRRGRAGNVSEAVVAGGGAAAGSVLVHVRSAAEDCRGRFVRQGALRAIDVVLCRSQRVADDDSWHRAGFFPGAADYLCHFV